MNGRKGKYVFTISEYENTDCLRIRLGGEEAYIPMRDIYDAAHEHKEYLAAKARIDAMPEEERMVKAEMPNEEFDGITANLKELVFQALGEASMCWSETPKGVFDSDHAKEVGERLIAELHIHGYDLIAGAREEAKVKEIGGGQKLYASVEHGATVVSWETSVPDGTSMVVESTEKKAMPNLTPEQLNDPLFTAIWEVIKHWDVNVPEYYSGYCGATGSHVMLILNALHQLWSTQ